MSTNEILGAGPGSGDRYSVSDPMGVRPSTGGRSGYIPTTPGPRTPTPELPDNTPPPTGGSTPLDSNQAATLLAELRMMFPWVDAIGLSPAFFQDLVATAASADEIVLRLRQQPQYKARFLGMWREDGSMRMTEADYLRTEADYRQVLNQFGYSEQYRDHTSLVGFFNGDVSANELRDRLTTYRNVQEAGAQVKDVFYVYAGLDISDDDLYQAVVDPAAAQRLNDEYNARIAAQQFDYTTWITRATERGLQRVSEVLSASQRSGALTGDAVQNVLRTDPTFARSIMDAIYHNAGQADTQPMSLVELLSSFELAAIGAAAQNAGLELPTKERVAMIRQAGIDRAKATQAYSQYGQAAGILDDAVRRATGAGFTQSDFEDAQFLGSSAAQSRLSAGAAREEAAGKGSGQFRFNQNDQGRLVQQGLR